MAEQWLTYQQAGDLLGMSAEAARQRARRLKWRTQPGNDGRVLVLVPEGLEVRPRVRPPVQTPEQPPVQTGDDNALAGLLREQLERANAETVAERGRAERAEAEREAARAEREAARIAAARAEGEAAALRDGVAREAAARQAAEAEREAARQTLAEWEAGGPLARAWRAFLYRRGG